MCIIKLYTHQCNKIYDMTDPIKTITPVRGGGTLLFLQCLFCVIYNDGLPTIVKSVCIYHYLTMLPYYVVFYINVAVCAHRC